MDLLTVFFITLAFSLILVVFRVEREINKLKMRCRNLNERLDGVEKINGLSVTDTGFKIHK